MQAVQHLQWS